MTTILIIESDPPGFTGQTPTYATALELLGVETRAVAPFVSPISAQDLEGVDGVAFTGSGASWSTDGPEAAPLRDTMKLAFDAGLPCFGSCCGMNVAASLLGGSSGDCENGYEGGLALGITLTDPGKTHPMMAGRADGFAAPCTHSHDVHRVPDGMTVLARNAHSAVQAVAYEENGASFWGTQYHPEYTLSFTADAVERRGGADAAFLADLRAAETDPQAAKRLGASPSDLQPAARMTELRNWVAMVKARCH
ncbi:MAG: type 1 glutamine amidotransferase [Pseudomonadota bacterium]